MRKALKKPIYQRQKILFPKGHLKQNCLTRWAKKGDGDRIFRRMRIDRPHSIRSGPATPIANECNGLFTLENRVKPGNSFFIVSDQAQTVPLGKAMLENDPSEEGWTIEDEQCQKIGGGYKALKFRFLLFL
jgi:hypothetical protein